MARESEKAPVVVRDFRDPGLRQFVALAQQARARAMFEAAVTVADGRDLEQVAVEGRAAVRCAAEKVALPLADAGEVAGEAIEIAAMPAADRDVVLRAAGLERRCGEVAHLDRMIDQLIVVRRVIAAEAGRRAFVAGKRGRHAPRASGVAVGRDDLDLAPAIRAAVRAEEYGRAVEVAARCVEVGGADRKVECVDLRDHGHWRRAGAARQVSLASLAMASGRPCASARTATKWRANSRIR